MKRFSFSLEPLLKIRCREEDAVKQRIGAQNRKIIDAQTKMGDLVDTLQDMQAHERTSREEAVADIIALRASVSYRYALKNDILHQGKLIDTLRLQRNGLYDELAHARQKRRAIELIKERRYSQWRRNYLRNETNRLDDLAQQSFIRKKRTAHATG